MATFPVKSDFSRKLNHPFYLRTGEVTENVEKTNNYCPKNFKNYMAIFKELLLLNKL